MKKRISAVMGVLGVALVLAGCTTSAEPTQTNTSTPSKTTSTPTPSADDRPAPPQADPPKDEETALVDAKKTYVAYLTAQLPFYKNVALGPQYLSGYVVQGSPAWKVLADTSDHGVNTLASGGPMKWRSNDAMSYASTTTNVQDGSKNELGAVHLFGCVDDTSISYANPEVENTAGAPVAVVLVYVADAHAWMIQENRRLSASDSQVPKC